MEPIPKYKAKNVILKYFVGATGEDEYCEGSWCWSNNGQFGRQIYVSQILFRHVFLTGNTESNLQLWTSQSTKMVQNVILSIAIHIHYNTLILHIKTHCILSIKRYSDIHCVLVESKIFKITKENFSLLMLVTLQEFLQASQEMVPFFCHLLTKPKTEFSMIRDVSLLCVLRVELHQTSEREGERAEQLGVS